MKTPIIKISDDQHTITHESGFVAVFVEDNSGLCTNCIYSKLTMHNCKVIPCDYNKRSGRRNDTLTGVFKQFIK